MDERYKLRNQITRFLAELDLAAVEARFIREFGSHPTRREIVSFAIAIYGPDKIKAAWRSLHR